MDLVTGALSLLPSKLLELLKDEYKLQKSIRVKIQSVSWELESMHAALHKVAAVPWDQLDEQVKVWAREVREASYDMEDILDTFVVRVDGQEPADLSRLKRAMKKMGDLFSKGKARHDISCAIEDIRKQLQEVAERRARYRVDDLVATPAPTTSIDPRLSALYTKVSQLIGVQEPRDKVISLLTAEEQMEMKIVSIVGSGGLGKTTLAKAVYENLTVDVHFKAFVPVGQNPDLKKVLRDILIGLGKQRYTMEFNLTLLDEKQLIDELREFLKNKRYFIVIDDVWDVSSWNIIRYALYDNSLGSKIVITTRKHDVAMKVGCSYNMKPLPYESSKELFYGRIFGSEQKCPKTFVKISEQIIKKCGGVPLAIITTSSLLANKLGNMKEWYEFCESIGSGHGNNHDMENMRRILSLSYYDLPAHLKTCLLYISLFPEDSEIDRDRLIWRWIAEGFVSPGEGGKRLFDIGKGYFSELLNRSLIQPARIVMDYDDVPQACRVHDMVLDLICSLSREESFVASILGDTLQNTPSWARKVRRLSLHNTTWPTIMDMSKLRSLTIFNNAIISSMPSLSCYQLLRVLDLENCNLGGHPNLSFVGNLFHLRYLGLLNTRYDGELRLEMGKLHHLQILDIYGTRIKELPSSFVGLKQLMRLILSVHCRPNGLRNLTSLEELWFAIVDSVDVAEDIGHLRQMRELQVELEMNKESGCDESICKALVASLGKLQKIEQLTIASGSVPLNLEGSVESLGNLSYLVIDQTASFPTWINPGSLLVLSYLDITVARLRREDIQVLGMLQALHFLEVTVSGDVQAAERFMVGSNSFPCARECRFYGFHVVPSMFPPGAMPRVENFCFSMRHEDFGKGEFTTNDLALGHLPSLRRVIARLYDRMVDSKEVVIKVEETLRHESDVHPNHPYIRVEAYGRR
ncbi:disease resistance protein RGA5-like [Miscanthus floridulus]|uniref:disease resistance protein RGA5-like n=1 Tax=Miscanthus floridulus TaxID=154761 RepID=UPI003457C97C